MARYGLASDRLSPLAREAAAEAGLGPVCRNPFQSIVVRSVEILYALDEAIRIIESYEEPDRPAVEVPPRAGTGYGWTEAPRGMLWHSYTIDDEGTILDAKIVPPTSQNQRTIEEDLRALVGRNLDLSDEPLQMRCEQAIRNFDPCISCATHFLTLDRGPRMTRPARDRRRKRVAQRRRRRASWSRGAWPRSRPRSARGRARGRARRPHRRVVRSRTR